MKNLPLIAFVLLTLFSCDNVKSNKQKEKSVEPSQIETNTAVKSKQELKIKVDKAYIGMAISELKTLYHNAEFIEEPVYEYGIDGESKGLVVKQNDEKLFFVWTLQGEERVHGITILSDTIIIDDNVHVGMTLKSFIDKYPATTVHIDMIDERYEYLNVPELSYRPEFLTTDSTRVAEYDYEQPEPEFKSVRNRDARIERISVN